MSKWISGFPPNKNGNYLVRKSTYLNPKFYYDRYEFDISNLGWFKYGLLQWGKEAIGHSTIIFEWWDEYGITETKIIKKLKFKL